MRGNTYRRFFKRAFDLVVCLAALPVVVPVLVLIAVAIRIDSPGPVLFVQQRTGRGGRRFPMLKFRTMVRNAEEQYSDYRTVNGIRVPFETRMVRSGSPVLARTLSNVTFNAPIDPSLFARPQ